ncbi:MAG: prepilin-type N-terminal cleavage/methylation domain-containing protein, partial [Dehalococcoidia bacterium]
MKFLKTAQKGFTLIELLVVISILGVLAAVVILNVTKYMSSGKTQAAATELANVQTA